jgi:membrane fusion protein, multidrug efflux system
MKNIVIIGLVVALVGIGIAFYTGMFSEDSSAQTADQAGATADGRGGRDGGGFGGGGFRGGGARQPMTVEVGTISRASIADLITVVGNLIGEATVSVAPRAAGRVESVSVRLGDRVTRGQQIARIEDFEIKEQVKQADAALAVSEATIRQREADLKLAETNVERSRNLFQRQLLPKQTLDDNESRYQSALASVDLARAQHSQSKARLDELRINLANTIVSSPVNGFIARRAVDPGASVSQNAPVVDVVDITRVRLVANVVEKDLTQMKTGNVTAVEVDAFPGEMFMGRIARIAPVLDPATRTASIEIEIPNPDFRLKPGMYARVGITTGTKKDALVAPANAVIDLGGRRGVFLPQNNQAVFRTVQVGTEQGDVVEILGGVTEGDTVITTGAAALRDGDRVLLPGRGQGGGRNGRRGEGGQPGPTASDGGRRGSGDGVAAERNPGSTGTGGRRSGGGAAPGDGARQGAPGAASPESGRRFGGQGEGGRRFGGEGRRGGQRGTPPPGS